MRLGLEIVATKLSPPPIRGSVIERFRLNELVNRHGRPRIVALRAPAGYGKSTLAVQLVKARGLPAAWYQLDRADNDLQVFVKHFIASIGDYLSLFWTAISECRDLQELATDSLRLVPLLDEPSESMPQSDMVVVLENCHLLSDLRVQSLLREIVTHAPQSCTFVLTGRDRLPIDIGRYVVSSEAISLEVEDFKFTESEVKALLTRELGPPDPGLIQGVCAKTDGWPALVGLIASELIAHGALPDRIPHAFYEYLESEVLGCLDERLRKFMETTSILDRLTLELCDAYLGSNDSAGVLKSLSQAQLVVPAHPSTTSAFSVDDDKYGIAEARLGLANVDEALRLARLCCDRSVISEDAHVLVMITQARLGNIAAVKEQYKLLSSLLDEELGAKPSSETRRLYYHLCTGRV